uniref:AB hydrolase-1 domain-containing protein n=1 Tax=Triticum urartu TaxID=4572 RepID=A0A8R7TD25_TRIUA
MSQPSSSSFHGSDVRGDDFTPAIDRRSMQRLEGHELIKALNVKYTPGAQPLLVLSHGFGCDKSVWHKVISNLRDSEIHSGILTYDLAFSGKVGKDYYHKYSDRYQTIDGYVEDVVSILQYYNIHTCIFVGHSTSGLVGLQASIRHRDLFSQLVLIGTAPCALDKFPDYMIGYSRERADERLKLMEVDYKKFVETYIEIALPGNTKDSAKLKLNTCCRGRPEMLLNQWR